MEFGLYSVWRYLLRIVPRVHSAAGQRIADTERASFFYSHYVWMKRSLPLPFWTGKGSPMATNVAVVGVVVIRFSIP